MKVDNTLFGKKIDFLLVYMLIGFVFLSFRGMPWGSGSSSVMAFMLFFAGVFGTFVFKWKELKLGPKVIYIPLLLILYSAFIWLFLDWDKIGSSIFFLIVMIFMFGIYVTAISKGHNLTYFAVPIIIILSFSVMWDGIDRLIQHEIFIARATGFSDNTDQIASILTVCIFLLRGKWKWLAFPAVGTILFTGSYWALMALVGCSLIAICKREVHLSRRFLLAVGVCVLVLFIAVTSSTNLRERVWQEDKVRAVIEERDFRAADSLDTRWYQNESVIDNFSFVGHGFYLETNKDGDIMTEQGRYGINIHNVPMLLLDDIGLLASLAWTFVTLSAIWVSKRYRYALLAIFIMSATGSADWWWFNLWMPFYFALLGLVSLEVMESKYVPRWEKYRGYYWKRFKRNSPKTQ